MSELSIIEMEEVTSENMCNKKKTFLCTMSYLTSQPHPMNISKSESMPNVH